MNVLSGARLSRRSFTISTTALVGLSLVSCTAAVAGGNDPPAQIAQQIGRSPPTATSSPTATAVPPTATSTSVPPTATPSPVPSPTPSPTATPAPLTQLVAPILMYHNFDQHADIYSVRPDLFRAQLKGLKAAGYTPVTMRQIADAFDRGATLPAHPMVVTMDDGRETQKLALQILKDEGVNATLFVPSGWHELSKDFVVQLDREGYDIESHTVWHADLVRTPEKITEIGEGQKTLEDWLGHKVDGFAYPYGHYLPRDITELRRLGFRYAVSIRQSVLLRADEIYVWLRLLVTNYQPADLLARINYLTKQAQSGQDPRAPATSDG